MAVALSRGQLRRAPLARHRCLSTGSSSDTPPRWTRGAADPRVEEAMMRAARARQALEEAMYSREEMRAMVTTMMRERSRQAGAGALVALGVVGCVGYAYRKRVKEVVVDELSDVGSRSLGDTKMQAQAQQVTIQTLNALLEDEGTQQRAATFVAAVAQHPAARQALVGALVDALKSRPVLDEALALTNWVLDRPEAREKLVDALLAALRSERFLQGAGAFGARWVERDEVRAAVGAALNGAALKVLEDAQVRDIAQIFVKSLLEQPHLQAKTSEHIWGAIKGVFIGPPRAARAPQSPAARRLSKEAEKVAAAPVEAAAPSLAVEAGEQVAALAAAAGGGADVVAAVAAPQKAPEEPPAGGEPPPPKDLAKDAAAAPEVSAPPQPPAPQPAPTESTPG
jgi:hypothetical protein